MSHLNDTVFCGINQPTEHVDLIFFAQGIFEMPQTTNPTEIKFLTIDTWGRPVFKAANGNLYGSLDKLFDYDADEEEVLKTVTEADITYFGRDIDDDPMGTSTSVVIVKN